jgi:hypothetical protein
LRDEVRELLEWYNAHASELCILHMRVCESFAPSAGPWSLTCAGTIPFSAQLSPPLAAQLSPYCSVAVVAHLGTTIGWVVHGYIVRESIPARQNSTHTRTHKRLWVWISTHTRIHRVSAIRRIPVTRPPTTILAFNIKQQFYHISKTIIIPSSSNDNFSTNQHVIDKNWKIRI